VVKITQLLKNLLLLKTVKISYQRVELRGYRWQSYFVKLFDCLRTYRIDQILSLNNLINTIIFFTYVEPKLMEKVFCINHQKC